MISSENVISTFIMIGKGLNANAVEEEGLCLILGAVLSLTWKDYVNPRDTLY
jgi:hypothetical protein